MVRVHLQPWLRPVQRREALGAALVWAVPVVIIGLIYFSPRHIASPETVLTALVGLGILALATRRPDLSLLGLIVFLPFQGLLLAKLWSWGMPDTVVRHLGAWKECLALGVIVAGVRNLLASPRRLDLIDRLALGFVALAILYAAFQATIVPGAPAASNIRLLGFRETAGFVLLLFGARHAPLGPAFARRAARTVFIAGVVVAGAGVYEAVASSAWNRFVVHTMRYTQYQAIILHTKVPNPWDIRTYGYVGGTKIIRVGSVFVDALSCAWFLILPLAVGIERLVRRTGSWPTVLGTLLIAAALLLTQTRSAILGGLIAAVLVMAPAAGRPRHWRTQLTIVLAAVVALGIPTALATGLAGRLASTTNQNTQSTSGHISGFWSGINTMGSHPLGLGLGTAAGTGQRFAVHGYVIPENNYLEVGDELGIVPGVIFLALTLALLVGLRRLARRRSEALVSAAWGAGVGLAVAAWFLQTWSDFAVSWTFWGLAGAMLGLTYQQARAPAGATAPEAPAAVGYSRPAGEVLPSASR